MRKIIHPTGFKLWLSARDTYNWANRAGASWPCSMLADKRVFVEFDRNGLCDLGINGHRTDCSVHELNAIVSDAIKPYLPKDHPCYDVAVGQFQTH